MSFQILQFGLDYISNCADLKSSPVLIVGFEILLQISAQILHFVQSKLVKSPISKIVYLTHFLLMKPTRISNVITCTNQAFSQGPKRGRPILVQRYIYMGKEGGGSRKRSSGKPLKFMLPGNP